MGLPLKLLFYEVGIDGFCDADGQFYDRHRDQVVRIDCIRLGTQPQAVPLEGGPATSVALIRELCRPEEEHAASHRVEGDTPPQRPLFAFVVFSSPDFASEAVRWAICC
jgi:hypothetical protein